MYFYVYRITNIKLKKHYYGKRKSKIEPKEDLGKKYFSSSKDLEFLLDQKENNKNYKYKIIKICKDKFEAIDLEIKLHKKFNVGHNINFYNKVNQTSKFFDSTGKTWEILFGKEKAEKRRLDLIKLNKEKVGEKNPAYKKPSHCKGIPLSKEQKEKLSKNRKGKSYKEICKTEESYLISLLKKTGENNPKAINIKLYDNYDNLIISSRTKKDFFNFCRENKYPLSFYNKRNKSLKQTYSTKRKDKIKYNGWYVIVSKKTKLFQ